MKKYFWGTKIARGDKPLFCMESYSKLKVVNIAKVNIAKVNIAKVNIIPEVNDLGFAKCFIRLMPIYLRLREDLEILNESLKTYSDKYEVILNYTDGYLRSRKLVDIELREDTEENENKVLNLLERSFQQIKEDFESKKLGEPVDLVKISDKGIFFLYLKKRFDFDKKVSEHLLMTMTMITQLRKESIGRSKELLSI